MHYKKEMESLREQTGADGHKIRELEYKMKQHEHKFEADKALMVRDAYKAQLNAANTSYEKGLEAMIDLMTKAVNLGNGNFMPNWDILSKSAQVVEMEDVNAHAKRKEEACKK